MFLKAFLATRGKLLSCQLSCVKEINSCAYSQNSHVTLPHLLFERSGLEHSIHTTTTAYMRNTKLHHSKSNELYKREQRVILIWFICKQLFASQKELSLFFPQSAKTCQFPLRLTNTTFSAVNLSIYQKSF